MNSEPKVIIDLKEYKELKNTNMWLQAQNIDLKSELRKAHKTINSLKEALSVVVKKDE